MKIKTTDQYEKSKTQKFFNICRSEDELRAWFSVYLDLKFPDDIIDPDSTANPIKAAYEIYSTLRDNTGDINPGYIMLSAREGYKTLIASALEVACMFHFKITISHMAAILDQSDKAISYNDTFITRTQPYWSAHGWTKLSDNKKKIEFTTPDGKRPYIKVVIATMAGANSEHCTALFIDEIDVVRDPRAYDEAMFIPSVFNGVHPITVKLSTRKFAFGMMQKELEKAKDRGEKILRWNVLDLSEKCREDRRGKGPKEHVRYVARSLPFRQITEDYYNENIADNKKSEWERVVAYEGCLKCPLLPVCKTRLADKPETAVANGKTLYKSITAIISAFKRASSPDIAEAQLLCWKPSTKGLVYPRTVFDMDKEESNVLRLSKAYERLMGDTTHHDDNTPEGRKAIHDMIVEHVRREGIPVYAGVDWGYTKEFAIIIAAIMPWGDVWILDTFGMPDFELSDRVKIAKEYQEKYNVDKWFCDPAEPGSIKAFKKAGLRCPEFTKEVMTGIEAVRGQIVDTMGKRRFKLLYTDENRKLMIGLQVHHFKLDAQGNSTKHPDDKEYSDVCDALRYIFQNLFDKKGKKMQIGKDKVVQPEPDKPISEINSTLMTNQILSKVAASQEAMKPKSKRGLKWNI